MYCLQDFNLQGPSDLFLVSCSRLPGVVMIFLQMFQGDLTADYTHTGYKQTVKHQRVFRAADYISSPAETDWCQSAAKSLLQVCGRHVIINNIMFIIPSLMLSGQLLYV